MKTLDCQTCGACCCNTLANQREGFAWYVEVEPDGSLLRRKDLAQRYVREAPDGTPHLRLDQLDRCHALRGSVGQRVTCAIYHHRPRACRRVQPGDADCLRARRERGLDSGND